MMQTPKSSPPGGLAVLRAIRNLGLRRGAYRNILEQLVLRGNYKDDFYCYPSVSLLAHDTGQVENSVIRGLRELVADGLIIVTKRSNKSSTYRINVAHIMEIAAKKETPRCEPDHVHDADVLDETEDQGDLSLSDVLDLIELLWPEHKSLRYAGWRKLVGRDLGNSITEYGAEHIIRVLEDVAENQPKVNEHVASSRMIGRYIAKILPQLSGDEDPSEEPIWEEEEGQYVQ